MRRTVRVKLEREWSALEKTAERRRTAASCLLGHLLDSLPAGSRGVDLLAETTLGKLLKAFDSDIMLRQEMKNPNKLMERALLWLHELEVIRLNKGLAVFRPAMSIRLAQGEQGKRGFRNTDYAPLREHYLGQTIQIHIMKAYARLGLEDINKALHLALDYFKQKQDDFLGRWLPDAGKEIGRQTTPESWRNIVECLDNPDATEALLRTSGIRPTYWCWLVPAPARRGCWCIASPTCCGLDVKIRAVSWRWLTTVMPRLKSAAGLQTWLAMMPGG